MIYTFKDIIRQGLLISKQTQKPYRSVYCLKVYLHKNGYTLNEDMKVPQYILTDKDIKKLNKKACENIPSTS